MTDKRNPNSSVWIRHYKVGVCYLQHVGSLLAPLGHVLRFSQQIVEEARFIQLANKLALEAVLHMVDQEVHHCLRHTAVEGGGEEHRPNRWLRTRTQDGLLIVLSPRWRGTSLTRQVAVKEVSSCWSMSYELNTIYYSLLSLRGTYTPTIWQKSQFCRKEEFRFTTLVGKHIQQEDILKVKAGDILNFSY